jgi:hypothetical protein
MDRAESGKVQTLNEAPLQARNIGIIAQTFTSKNDGSAHSFAKKKPADNATQAVASTKYIRIKGQTLP